MNLAPPGHQVAPSSAKYTSEVEKGNRGAAEVLVYNGEMSPRHLLFIFLDGVGLGKADAVRNPFCAAHMPTLTELLGEGWFLAGRGRVTGPMASLAPTDACLGVPGRPQSATGQAALLTGRNVPAEVGGHFGPKPTPAIASILRSGNLFSQTRAEGGSAILLNPYPPQFFEGIKSGRRLMPAIPLAARAAGIRLLTHEDLVAGRAVSPDFTGEGWRERLGRPETPLLSPWEAGERLAAVARSHSLVFLEHWPTDIIGHRKEFRQAVEALDRFDRVLAGVVDTWDWEAGSIIITSDHGNIEDLGVRTHTLNAVPTVAVGQDHEQLAAQIGSLPDIAPAVLGLLRECRPDRQP